MLECYLAVDGYSPSGPHGLHGSAFFQGLPALVVIVSVAAWFHS